ncbi:FkbM family methyltransferase [Hoeflea sp.]|uniref:FkbM family methyltransferase n=1 Tax=Hoeflea sp. TaxID=1940281 RepID=UPI003B52D881
MTNIITRNLQRARTYAGLLRQTAGQVAQINEAVRQVDRRISAIHDRIDAIPGSPGRQPEEGLVLPSTEIAAHGGEDSFRIPKFWEPNFWEPTVQIALRDYCRPGDVVFDVGANAGGLSLIMSRHVGPRGVVCSFEASPRIIDKTHYNLVNGGCTNVYLSYRAVYHTSHELVTMYPGTHLNDSIYNDYGAEGGASYEVETLALDDFVAASGLMPSFIKMDIEGAEYDALKGAANILKDGKPGLILEQSPGDMRCHELLTEAGYVAIDLGNYRHIKSAADFDEGVGITNILFIHKDKAAADPYVNASAPVEVMHLSPEAFTRQPNGSLSLTEHVELPRGRYLCKAHFTAAGTDNEIFAGIDSNRGRLFRYHTYTQLMAANYTDWVFSLRSTSKVTPYIQFLNGKDDTFDWKGATLYRFESFDSITPPVLF